MIVVDSKVLFLSLDTKNEAHYVCGILNSPIARTIIDGYAVNTNRGIDVLKYLAIPKFDENLKLHNDIASLSQQIHTFCKNQIYGVIDKIHARKTTKRSNRQNSCC